MNEAMAEGGLLSMVKMTVGSILCCKCGIRMAPNAANICLRCLSTEVDVTQGLQKHLTMHHCPKCERYLKPPSTWVKAQLESKELLQFCVKRLKNMSQVRLVDAAFVWTEPHSKRIKLRLKVQKEVFIGLTLEQSYVVEFVLREQTCRSCSRADADPDQWVATVQLRQHASHKRTILCLEQLILRHGAAASAIKIKQAGDGIDLFFAKRSHGLNFMNFVRRVAPTLRPRDHNKNKQLVSHDVKSNVSTNKYAFSLEISPVCRDDLICRRPDVAVADLGRLIVCTKVTNSITLLDPRTLKHSFMNAEQYRRFRLASVLTSRQLVEYEVLLVELVSSKVDTIGGARYALADVRVARVSDFGKNDTMFSTRTHLGLLLKCGDHALGYDLHGANISDTELDRYVSDDADDKVVLVKKIREETCQPKKRRAKKEDGMRLEYEQFLRELEEDPGSRFRISLDHHGGSPSPEMAWMTDDGEDDDGVDDDGDCVMRD